VPVVCRRLTPLLHSLLTNRRRAAVVSVNLGVTLEQSRALSALPAVQRVAVARDLVEKLGRAVRIDDAVRAPIIEVVIVTTLLLMFS